MITLRTNVQEVIGEMIAKILDPQIHDMVVRTVATTMLAELKMRVFEDGQASDGSKIGDYSTKPLYVSEANNPGKSFGRPIGKTGRSTFKGGKKAGQDHRSRYFPGGYNEFKTVIGRNELGSVNLSLSGQMGLQMTVIATSEGYGLGWNNDEMFGRANHFTKKYREIWDLTGEEKEQAQQIAEDEFFNQINT